jgi:hypothetical protein
MVKALAINAISITIFYLCGVIAVFTEVDSATLHTLPVLQFAVYGSLSVSLVFTITAGLIAIKRVVQRSSRRADIPAPAQAAAFLDILRDELERRANSPSGSAGPGGH